MSNNWIYKGTLINSTLSDDIEIELKSFIFDNLMKNYHITEENCKLMTELVFKDISQDILNNYLPHISGSNSEDDLIHMFIDFTLMKNPTIKNILGIVKK